MIYTDEIINEMEKELRRIPRSAIQKAYGKGFENGKIYESSRTSVNLDDAYMRGYEEGKKSNESIIKDLNQDLTDAYKQLVLDEKTILKIREMVEKYIEYSIKYSDFLTYTYMDNILEIIRSCMKGQTNDARTDH